MSDEAIIGMYRKFCLPTIAGANGLNPLRGARAAARQPGRNAGTLL